LHVTAEGERRAAEVTRLYTFRDLQRVEQTAVSAGEIIAVAGVPNVGIGDTLTDPDDPRPLPPITVEEPTVRMTFSVNDSPFAGREGQYVTGRQLRDRLYRELESNVALRVNETDRAGEFLVSGRGELHLAILIETMRREGYEFAISRPEVIVRVGENGMEEPVEEVFLEVPEDYLGAVTEMMGRRRGEMVHIRYGDDGVVYTEYRTPTRGMLGFRQPFLTATRGAGIYHTLFHGYVPFRGEIESHDNGSLVSLETGEVSAYALQHLTARGTFFVAPTEQVYGGQVVGQHIRDEDLVVNVCRTKNLTGHRAVPKAITDTLPDPRRLSLDECIEYLGRDDLLEVTPAALRIRKKELRHNIRQKQLKRAKA
jgi:GTP-binding protein